MTIKWDAEHPDSNTCVEQWHYNVDFLLNNDRCSSDDFLNRDDGSIDMIVYKVEGPRSNFGGISSISSMGNPKDFEWLRNGTKPTARQISISKSLTESMVKQNLCWTGHLIPPPPTENASIKWPVQVKPLKKQNLCWTGHFIPPPPTENASIKWPVQVKPLKKQSLCWTGHFIPPPPTENASIKWPVQVKPLKKENLCWNGHFIPPPPTENASIKWPVQVKPLKKQNLCWTRHFIPPPPTENASNTLSFERGPWGERGPGRAARARAKMASILRPFWRARAARPGPHSPWGPLSREIFFSIKWPVQVKPLKKQNLCWTGHFIPPPQTENASIKWPVQVKPLKKQNLCWTGHFIPPPPTENASIKWPVQVKPLKKQNLCWTGHFIPPPPTENASIKWPVQVKPLKKQNLCWTGHFIPPPPTENASIKWPVQVKPLKKTHFYLEWPLYTPASRLQDFDPETEGLTTR